MTQYKQFYKDYIFKIDHVFAGSFSLHKQFLLNRTYSDFDIVLDSNLQDSLNDHFLESIDYVENISRSYKPNRFTDIKTVHFKDQTKIDLLFRSDIDLLDKVELQGIKYLHYFEIIKEKINLIQQNNQKEKHIKDIEYIFSKIK